MCTDLRRETSSGSALSRLNAWFFDRIDRYANFIARFHKDRAFEGLRRGTIVELGAGTGANFRYLPRGSRLVALEPSRAMHPRLQRNAELNHIELQLVEARAECIPIEDESVDEVIATLVLCTVVDPTRVLAEVLRILRPGGTFRFVEHIVAPTTSLRRRVQRLLAPPWAWLFEGCDVQRNTADLIASAGFSDLTLERRRFHRSLFYPVNFAMWGIATKGSGENRRGPMGSRGADRGFARACQACSSPQG